ncbi:MAG: hypothetical protein Q9191_006793, partial [Dirinaria sp. TL-2023a]
MPDNDASSESTRSEHKFFKRHSWRGKLFSNDDKASRTEDAQQRQATDIAEFLEAPAKKKEPSQQLSVLRGADKPTPPLPRVPVVESPANQSTGSSRAKPARRKGLHVTFDTSSPVIIGQGGDEAELPPIKVRSSQASANSRTHQRAPDAVPIPRRYSPPVENGRNIRQSLRQGLQGALLAGDEDLSTFPPLRGKLSDFHAPQPRHVTHAAIQDTVGRDDSVPGQLSGEESLQSPYSDTNSEGLSAIYASYTQSPPLSPDVVIEQTSEQPSKGRFDHQANLDDTKAVSSLKPFSPDNDPSLDNSLTPSPSPKPANTQTGLPSSYGHLPTYAVEEPPTWQAEPSTQHYQAPFSNQSDQEILTRKNPAKPSKEPPAISLRNVARGLGEDALNEFSVRVQRFNSIFRLGATAGKVLDEISFTQWIRAAAWWFLKGRAELESAVRGRPGSRDRYGRGPEVVLSSVLKQAYLNLAKGRWILTEITPSHRELSKYGNMSTASLISLVRNVGDSKLAELLEIHDAITANMLALAMSMKRNNRMPPHDFEPQGLDARIWVEIPRFASGVAGILAGKSSRSLLDDDSVGFVSFPYPVGDTTRHFNYGSIFVDVVLCSSDDDQARIPLSCVLTILRHRTHRELEVVLASQDGQLNLVIQSHRKTGPTWRDVRWKTESSDIILTLADGLDLNIHFQEQNFRSLWGVYDYTKRVGNEMHAGDGEALAFQTTVRCVHYIDTPDAKTFPPEPVHDCDVLLFEKSLTISGGSGRRLFYNGHRLVVVTPPGVKTLNRINQSFGKQFPMLFSFVRGEDGGPALLLKNDAAAATMVITFNDPSSRSRFQTLLEGTILGDDETCTEAISLSAMKVETSGDSSAPVHRGSLNQWRWHKVRIFNRDPRYCEHGLSRTVLSENLRLWAQCDAGSFIDRINLGPGELQISLAADKPTEITLLRSPQQDMTVSFASNIVSASRAQALSESVQTLSTLPSKRSYSFHSVQDLHTFQKAVTGFAVLYEGFASTFSISHRRMMVPINKRWEASLARLQIIQRGSVTQLLCFFHEFQFGSCMNFVVKSTDRFEAFQKSEQHCVKIVDAKFALPKKPSEDNNDFICLDMPEYPSEHDDITIAFESEA